MTALYGSTAMPKRVFGEGELLGIFEESMNELTPGCWEANKAFLALWDPTATAYSWVLPDNFHVHVKVMDSVVETVHFLNEPFDVISKVNAPVEQGRSLGANTIHSLDGMIVREMTRRCNYNPKRVEALFGWLKTGHAGTRSERPDDEMVQILWRHYQKSGYLSARILEHLLPENLGLVDPAVILELLETLPEKPFKVLSIHDCFRCLPTYGNDLRAQYTYQLHLIAKSSMLSFLLGQIIGRPIAINKLDPTLADDVMFSNYALS